MVDMRVLITPTPEDFGLALSGFHRTVAVVADYRSRTVGPSWISELDAPRQVFEDIERRTLRGELNNLIAREIRDNPVAYRVLFHELLYAQHRFRELIPFDFPLPDDISSIDLFGPDIGDPLDETDVKELDVIKGSIEKVLDTLPSWLKKLMEVGMELLKITRGAV